ARRADTEERPHPETEIERAGMNQQSFEYVLVPAHARSPEPTRFVEMRTRSLEQFAAFAEEPLAAVAADVPSIRIDRVPFGLLVGPRLWTAIGFADVSSNLQRLQIVYRGAAMIALVGDDLLDHHDGVGRDGGDCLELLGGFRQRLLNRRGVALVGALDGDAHD